MKTEILKTDHKSLALAKRYISEGEAVAFHTETVYGLGANAFSDEAVARIFAIKGRPADNPLIVHVHRGYDIKTLSDGMPSYAEKLMDAFLPGPLTLVFPSKGKVSGLVSCGLDTLAIRIPSSATAQAFLKETNLPIAAPSANLSKHVSPVSAEHVFEDLGGKIPLILDGGVSEGGIESTVLDCTEDVPKILRFGLITREQIASVAGECRVYERKAGEKPKSPGMAYKHYCPRTKTALADTIEEAIAICEDEAKAGGKPALLAESGLCGKVPYPVLELGATPEEMAARLYLQLRAAERIATMLVAVRPRNRGGVMDGVLNRLVRALKGGNDEA